MVRGLKMHFNFLMGEYGNESLQMQSRQRTGFMLVEVI